MDRGVSRQIRVSRHRAGLEPWVGELGGANLGRVAGPRGGQGPRGLLSPTCLGVWGAPWEETGLFCLRDITRDAVLRDPWPCQYLH